MIRGAMDGRLLVLNLDSGLLVYIWPYCKLVLVKFRLDTTSLLVDTQ